MPQVLIGMFKTPNSSNPFVVVLVVVVLIAIVEMLIPRVVRVVLCGTPIPRTRKTTNSHNKGVRLSARYLTDRGIAFLFAKKAATPLTTLVSSPFIAFKLKPVHSLPP